MKGKGLKNVSRIKKREERRDPKKKATFKPRWNRRQLRSRTTGEEVGLGTGTQTNENQFGVYKEGGYSTKGQIKLQTRASPFITGKEETEILPENGCETGSGKLKAQR